MTRILLTLVLLRLSMTHDKWFWVFAFTWAFWELLAWDERRWEAHNDTTNRI